MESKTAETQLEAGAKIDADLKIKAKTRTYMNSGVKDLRIAKFGNIRAPKRGIIM